MVNELLVVSPVYLVPFWVNLPLSFFLKPFSVPVFVPPARPSFRTHHPEYAYHSGNQKIFQIVEVTVYCSKALVGIANLKICQKTNINYQYL
jgi:hypothetical protein